MLYPFLELGLFLCFESIKTISLRGGIQVKPTNHLIAETVHAAISTRNYGTRQAVSKKAFLPKKEIISPRLVQKIKKDTRLKAKSYVQRRPVLKSDIQAEALVAVNQEKKQKSWAKIHSILSKKYDIAKEYIGTTEYSSGNVMVKNKSKERYPLFNDAYASFKRYGIQNSSPFQLDQHKYSYLTGIVDIGLSSVESDVLFDSDIKKT